MVVLLSALCAVPGGLLAWKLCSSPLRPSELLVSFATSIMSGTLVMAVLAPLIALYYQTSAWMGPMLGLASTFTALTVATVTFLARRAAARSPRSRGARCCFRRWSSSSSRWLRWCSSSRWPRPSCPRTRSSTAASIRWWATDMLVAMLTLALLPGQIDAAHSEVTSQDHAAPRQSARC